MKWSQIEGFGHIKYLQVPQIGSFCIEKYIQGQEIWPFLHIKTNKLPNFGQNTKATNNSTQTLRHSFGYPRNKNQGNLLHVFPPKNDLVTLRKGNFFTKPYILQVRI
jgi:hypothetical protein